MRLHTKIAQPSGNGPAKVMQSPGRHRLRLGFLTRLENALVEPCLAIAPTSVAALPNAEYVVTIEPLWLRLDDSQSHNRQLYGVGAPILAALSRDPQYRIRNINFRPSEVANFLAAQPRQDQQTNDITEVAIAKGVPDFCQFIVTQHPIARLWFRRPVRANDRVAVRQTLTHGPGIKRRQTGARTVCCARPVIICDLA